VEQVPDIPAMPMPMVQNTGSKTLPSFITDAPSTVFFAKTGRIENGFGIKKD
jgi:hypothetical protein